MTPYRILLLILPGLVATLAIVSRQSGQSISPSSILAYVALDLLLVWYCKDDEYTGQWHDAVTFSAAVNAALAGVFLFAPADPLLQRILLRVFAVIYAAIAIVQAASVGRIKFVAAMSFRPTWIGFVIMTVAAIMVLISTVLDLNSNPFALGTYLVWVIVINIRVPNRAEFTDEILLADIAATALIIVAGAVACTPLGGWQSEDPRESVRMVVVFSLVILSRAIVNRSHA